MKPNAHEDKNQVGPVAMILFILGACLLVGGSILYVSQVRRTNLNYIRIATEAPLLGDRWLTDLVAGKFDDARKPASSAFRPTLTDARLAEFQALAQKLGPKPSVSGWEITDGGGTRFRIGLGEFLWEQRAPIFNYLVVMPRPSGVAPEELVVNFTFENDQIVITGMKTRPSNLPTAPPAQLAPSLVPVPPSSGPSLADPARSR